MRRKITSREKVMLMVMIMAVILWIGYVYGVEPLMQKREELKLELRLAESQLKEIQDLLASEPQFDIEIAESYKQIEVVAETYFNTTPQEEYILLLNDFFLLPSIEGSSFGFAQPQMMDFGGVQIRNDSVSVEFSGDYDSMLNLFRTMWAFSKKIHVTNLVVNSDEEEDTINGSATINLYTFAADSTVVDGLYKWYVDELFHKENPFVPYETSDALIRYLYLKDDNELFNYGKYSQFIDIDGNWMQSEIEIFLEKGYLYLNPYLEFGPNEPMTRGEFVVLLDNVYNWPIVDEEVDLSSFRDYNELGSLESSFAKAIYKGYLSGIIEGYDDNTLRPLDPISYKEVELIMNRIKGTNDFNWDTVAQSIMQMKGIQREAWNNKNNPITRAEAIFLLYYMK